MTTTEFVLHEGQKQVATDMHRFRVICAGRRWGKTQLVIDQMKACAAHRKGSKIAYIAPTYQQARDICWMQLRAECEQAAETINESRLEVRLVNGSQIALRGWENIETLRGQSFDLIVIDEIAMMRNFWEMWHEVIRPTLTDRRGEGIFISTPKGFNHFYDLFNLGSEDKDFKSFHFSTYDNPHIPQDEVDKAKEELTEDRFAQEYLADFRKTEGLVYKEFDRKRHLFKDKESWYEKNGQSKVRTYGGVDFGFVHPAAVLTIEETSDGVFLVTDEWYHSGKTDEEIAEYVAAQKFNATYPDPANAGGIKSLKDNGVHVRDVIKGKDSIKNGINVVRELFKSNRLFFSERCHNLIMEMETYSYADSRDGMKIDENPIKVSDDACFVAGTIVNGRPIEEIGVTTGTADVYEYTVAGEKLEATPNHPVITHRGVVHIDALRYDDVVWKQKKLLFMTASNGLDTQTLVNGVTGITTSVLESLRGANERDYTDIYGTSTTGLYQRATTSITLMGILLIMKYLTLLALTAGNTLRVMLQRKSVNLLDKISGKLFWLLPSGVKQRLAKNVVGRLVFKTHISCLSVFQSLNSVTSAKKPTPQKATEGIDSAILTVGKKHYVGHVPVYNLKTKSGMYHANGILVHNCDALRYCLMMVNNRKGHNRMIIRRPQYAGFNQRK